MKLYTEEQVKSMINRAKIFDGDVGENFVYILSDTDIISAEAPIELPSNEEINIISKNKSAWEYNHETNFKLGARWMKEQILNQNNMYSRGDIVEYTPKTK